jgi:hypothetical protein
VLTFAAPPLPSVVGLSPAPQTSAPTVSTQTVVKLDSRLVPDPDYGSDFTTSGTYPQFTGAGGLDAVNTAIRNAIVQDQQATKALFTQFGSPQPGVGPGIYSTDPAKGIISASSALVSVLIPRTAIFPGGNDGGGWISTTVLVPSVRAISLSDLFADQAQGLDTIATSTKTQALADSCIGTNGDNSALDNAVAPTTANYQHFALSPSGITVGFDQGSLGTEACGAKQFTVPWSMVRPLLNALGSQLIGELR